jgi:hypothetical protein
MRHHARSTVKRQGMRKGLTLAALFLVMLGSAAAIGTWH